MGAPRSEASMGALLGMLASDTGQLVRHELRLASFEIIDRARHSGQNIGTIALGGALAHAGLLGLLAAAVFGLSYVIPIWAASLIVGAIVFAVGYGIVQKGLARLKGPMLVSTPTINPPLAQTLSAKEGVK